MTCHPFRVRLVILAAIAVFHVLSTVEPRGAEIELDGQIFTIPEGFTLERVAGPPLVDRPIEADFDDLGRLFVSDSAGVNDKMEVQLKERRHRILRLEDTDGDGRFDSRTVFADRMMFPEGILCHEGAVYCAAPPSIWKLEDTNEDGVADKRSEWFRGGVLTGCANDLHGPYLGPEGWIYWCKGGFGKLDLQRPGKPGITDSAAHIFRCRPDGSELEAVISGGMDNPVTVAFTESGDAIFTTTFYAHPRSGNRDALVHAVFGGVYPKSHGVIDGLPRTGDLLPPLTHLGAAAPCGLAVYRSSVFGASYTGNLFSTQFNLHKVQRHVLSRRGSTFTSRDEDFLSSDNVDFHPTDVLEDADGSLLVLDTGGWYKICCPTSQIAKPDVLGAIYRLRREGAPRIEDPRGAAIAWGKLDPAGLIAFLDDPRPCVRQRAIRRLGNLGETSLAELGRCLDPEASKARQLSSVWALARIAAPNALAVARKALAPDFPDAVRQAAAHVAGIRHDAHATEALSECLLLAGPAVRREAATALGRIGDPAVIPSLLGACLPENDRILAHALTYALIEIADARATRRAMGDSAVTSEGRRAALIALDQMLGSSLGPDEVLPLLASGNEILRDTAWWISERHPEWGDRVAVSLRPWILAAADKSPADRIASLQQLIAFCGQPGVRNLMAEMLLASDTPVSSKRFVLDAIHETAIKELPDTWEKAILSSLGNDTLVRPALQALRNLPHEKARELNAAIRRLAASEALDPGTRLDAIAALPDGLGAVDDSLFEFLVGRLEPANRPLDRVIAARALGKSALTADQRDALTRALPATGPLELPEILPAYREATEAAQGVALVTALRASPGLANVRPELMQEVFASFPDEVRSQASTLMESMRPDAEAQRARLKQLEPALDSGDIAKGHKIFNSARTACATCHRIGYGGGLIGPNLSRIGSIRSGRDLLEAIVFPSASFARGFETMLVATRDEQSALGIIRKETGDHLYLINAAGQEQRFHRRDITAMSPAAVSLMPAGLEAGLTETELADLLAFLQSLK